MIGRARMITIEEICEVIRIIDIVDITNYPHKTGDWRSED